MKCLIFISLILFFFSGWVQSQRPNVVIVLTDDQGYGEFSCNGNPLVHTPNIDRLAKEGFRFTDFHVAPMCTPTRGELLTGLDAFRNGAVNVSSGRTLLRADLPTMANVFKKAGYATAVFGKWHLGDNYPYRPQDRGFDETLWFPSSHINSVPDYWDNDYFDDIYMHNGNRKEYKGYCTDVFFDGAIKWMSEKIDEKISYFIYLPLNASHSPHYVPDKYRESIKRSIKEHPEIVKHLSESKKKELVSFLAMGNNIDENIGKLYEFLADNNQLEKTIIVFLTDNGSTFGADYYNAGMKGRKTQLWEGGHRVPLFIRTPSKICKSPKTIEELCQVQDLLPTLAAMSGIKEIPKNLDGMNLFPLMNGAKENLEERMLVINYSRMPNFKVKYTTKNPAIPQRDGAGVLWKNWRLIENRELYNIAADPHQDKDVALEYPEIVQKMRNHLNNWWDAVKDEVAVVQRVVIGNEQENPALLTACEWLDVFVDQQKQVRWGVKKNGVWHVAVHQPGEYQFELRRWPRESETALQDGLPLKKVTDGWLEKGVQLPVRSAKIRIGNREKSKKITSSDKEVTFTMNLNQGDTSIQTWFFDENNNEICGAYYLYVKRI
ncbi:sulfatase-like hydrolase/transferase [Maribellus comscasis]|uniref:Sulfatase-like hydrolase/transferase n=1 Tax=Maribellus comscasis TaxID=2681766 RepID=A0A6I6JSS9_9BACT|nr:arylsulfatase [Maribellus comscasis]QGY44289.1 sulfatase-like hydrolase/transferase [Maribellus comscasis]